MARYKIDPYNKMLDDIGTSAQRLATMGNAYLTMKLREQMPDVRYARNLALASLNLGDVRWAPSQCEMMWFLSQDSVTACAPWPRCVAYDGDMPGEIAVQAQKLLLIHGHELTLRLAPLAKYLERARIVTFASYPAFMPTLISAIRFNTVMTKGYEPPTTMWQRYGFTFMERVVKALKFLHQMHDALADDYGKDRHGMCYAIGFQANHNGSPPLDFNSPQGWWVYEGLDASSKGVLRQLNMALNQYVEA